MFSCKNVILYHFFNVGFISIFAAGFITSIVHKKKARVNLILLFLKFGWVDFILTFIIIIFQKSNLEIIFLVNRTLRTLFCLLEIALMIFLHFLFLIWNIYVVLIMHEVYSESIQLFNINTNKIGNLLQWHVIPLGPHTYP